MDIFNYITIDDHSRIPKYRQIVDAVIHHIAIGNLKMDEKIPSINVLSQELYLSRDTVDKAYKMLKKRNILTSSRGKGYYIARTSLISKVNVLFLMNKLSNYKLKIYNSFVNSIGVGCHTDVHIYHCDEFLFLNLLKKNLNVYDYFVIMPHFKTNESKHISSTRKVQEIINTIPEDKLILLDNNQSYAKNGIIEIYQNFENDIYNALNEGVHKIADYNKIILVYPERAIYPYPRRILHGFRKFCIKYNLDFEILDEIYEDTVLKKGDLFVTIEESDLVSLIKQIRSKKFTLGKDIGVISYNDTPLKELFGITVVSTDFGIMGETAAKMILNKEKGTVKNPFNFIDRNSI